MLALIRSYEYLERFSKEHFTYKDLSFPEFMEKLREHADYSSSGLFEINSEEDLEKMNEVLKKKRENASQKS